MNNEDDDNEEQPSISKQRQKYAGFDDETQLLKQSLIDEESKQSPDRDNEEYSFIVKTE